VAAAPSIVLTNPGYTLAKAAEAIEAAAFIPKEVEATIYTPKEIISARPDFVLLGSVSHPELRIRKAIPLEVLTEEGHVILTWVEADEFVCGDTTGDALDDFSKMIGELYFELNDPAVRLGENLMKVRAVLNEHIENSK
jgi:hypothetical protein